MNNILYKQKQYMKLNYYKAIFYLIVLYYHLLYLFYLGEKVISFFLYCNGGCGKVIVTNICIFHDQNKLGALILCGEHAAQFGTFQLTC